MIGPTSLKDSSLNGTFGSRGSIAVGAVWNAGTFAIRLAAGVPALALLVRRMSTEQYGALASVNSLLALVALAGGLGLSSAVTRFGAVGLTREGPAGLREISLAASSLARRSASSILVLVGVLSLILFAVPSLRPMAPVVVLSAPAATLAPFLEVADGLQRVTFRPRRIALAGISMGLGQISIAVLAVVLLDLTMAWQVAGLLSIATFLSYFVLERGLRLRHFRFRHSPTPPITRKMFSFGSAIVLVGLSGVAISQLDVFLLSLFRGRAAVGSYAPISLLADQVILLGSVVGSYYLPQVAGIAARSDHAEVGRLYRWSSRWTLVLSAPAIGVMLAAPTSLLTVVFGHRLSDGADVTRILAIAVLISLVLGFNGLTTDAYGLARALTMRSLVGLCVSFVACMTLIPAFGVKGAAVATGCGILVLNLTCCGVLIRKFRIFPLDVGLLVCVLIFLLSVVTAASYQRYVVHGDIGSICVTALWTGVPVLIASLAVSGGEDLQRVLRVAKRWKGEADSVTSGVSVR